MPSSHRRGACPRAGLRPDPWADWAVERIRREAATIGPATAALCELILDRRCHPEQGFRVCLGIVRPVRPFGADRLEAAATRAIEIGALTYGSVRSIRVRDNWGLEPLDAGARRDLYEILEERYGRRSTILTSQIPSTKWHAFIGEPTYADAILDRLVHNGHRIDLAGESRRGRRSRSIPKD